LRSSENSIAILTAHDETSSLSAATQEAARRTSFMRERKGALCVWACISAEQRRLKESRKRPLRTIGNQYLPHRMSGGQCADRVRNGRRTWTPSPVTPSVNPIHPSNDWPCVQPRRKKAE
jgi:hypothetical protein